MCTDESYLVWKLAKVSQASLEVRESLVGFEVS